MQGWCIYFGISALRFLVYMWVHLTKLSWTRRSSGSLPLPPFPPPRCYWKQRSPQHPEEVFHLPDRERQNGLPIKRPTYKYFMPHLESVRSRGCFAFQVTDFHIQGHGRERESRRQNIKRLEKRKRKEKGGERWWEREKGGLFRFYTAAKRGESVKGGWEGVSLLWESAFKAGEM